MNILIRGVGLLPRSWIKMASRQQWRHPLAKRVFDSVANRMRNQDATIQQGVGRGLRFNSGGSNAGQVLGTTEPGLQRAFALFLRPDWTVHDVGANVGFYSTISGRLVGPGGKIVAFEPLAKNVRMIAHNAALNGFAHVALKELALGKEDGEATFVMSADPNWGKLASIGVPDARIGELTVRVARLDSLVRDGSVPAPNLMKIDVEGAEADVLEGAAETLRSARPVLFIDLHGTNADVARLLKEFGYESRVLGGGDQKIETALWDAEVIAIPAERRDLFPDLLRMAEWSADEPGNA